MIIRKNDRVMEEVNNHLNRPDYFCLSKETVGDRSSAVVKVLCYKLEGRWFDSSRCYWNFSLI